LLRCPVGDRMSTGTRTALLTLGCSFVIFGAMLWLAFVYDPGRIVSLPSIAPDQAAGRTAAPLLAPTAGPPTLKPSGGAAAAGPSAAPSPATADAPDPAAPTEVDLHVPPSQQAAPFNQPRRLSVPPGFQVSVFAAGLRGARFMAIGPQGDLF